MFDRSAEYKNLILCVTSLLFVIWGKAFAVVWVFLSIIVDFILALAAEGSLKRNKQSAAVFMIVDFIFNAFLFLLLTHNSVFSSDSMFHLRNALLPVGAAFYTLKNFSYVYDVYSERIKAERNIFCLITYSLSYPFLLAGPIVRYGDIEPQIRKRSVDAEHLNSGLTSFALGFAKTVIVVPILSRLANAGLNPDEPTLAGAWIGMAAFFGTAYFTFMGLSDMGVGIARMNGFDVERNYGIITAKRMLGGLVESYNTSMVRLFGDIRGDGKAAPLLTLLAALIGTAFYAQHKFVFAFGAVIAVLLAAECVVGYDKIENIPGLFKLIAAFVLSMLLFSAFAFDSFSDWKFWFGTLFGKGTLYTLSKSVKYIIINNCWVLLIALISVTPVGRSINCALKKYGEGSPEAYGRVRVVKTVCTAILFALSFVLLAARTAGV
jgi:alginate O-acetyltransferase complex protein AlgI